LKENHSMSDTPNNSGNGHATGKPYAEMTPEERSRLMDFLLAQQAQFFANQEAFRADLAEMKELQAKNDRQIETLLQFAARHDRRIERADNILRLGVRAGRRLRSRVRETENTLDAVKELLLDNARQGGENRRDLAELRDAVKELLLDNARQNGENRRDLAELREVVANLTGVVAKLVERDGNGAG
jgi:hypothetical protein